MKRSNAPIFWLLFGAGGLLSALVGAGLVAATGFGALPDHAHLQAAMQHPLARLAAFGVVALFAWHAAHRIFHSLHDIGVHNGLVAKLACYGSAAVLSAVAAAGAFAV